MLLLHYNTNRQSKQAVCVRKGRKMPIQSICFILGQLVFLPSYFYITRQLVGRKLTLPQKAGYLLICPLSAYLYSIIGMSLLYLMISADAANALVQYSDFLVLLISFALVYIYGRKIGKDHSAARFLYLCLYMLAMPFNAGYESVPMTVISNVLAPIGVNLLFIWLICRPVLDVRDDCSRMTGLVLLMLPIAAEFMFMLRIVSFIFIRQHEELKQYDEALSIYNFVYAALILLFVFTAVRIILNNIENARDNRLAAVKMHDLSLDTIKCLVQAVDAKDSYTTGHSVRVARYSKMIAEKLGYGKEFNDSLYYTALLHDVGKIGVDDAILRKPGRLNAEEYAAIKEHTVTGSKILSKITSMPELMHGAMYHHERWDGGGYPEGLKGEAIPLNARIIAVADAYDAMSSNRSYRKAMSQQRVRAEIIAGTGTQFWPPAANAMLELIDADTNYEMRQRQEGNQEEKTGDGDNKK